MHSLTPPQHSLQLVIPGSDIKPPTTELKPRRPPQGLETPPPSAHDESRRESFHSLADLAFATGASARIHSDPSTPIHRIIHGWTDVGMSSANAGIHHGDRQLLSPGFSSQTYQSPTTNIVPIYQHVQQPICTNPLPLRLDGGLNSVPSWTGAVSHPNTFEPSMNFLGPELFSVSDGLPLGSSFHGSSLHSSETSLSGHLAISDQDRGLPPGLLYNEPHPVELSHSDRYDHSQVEYAAFEDDESALSRSLASSAMAFDFECVLPPSPLEEYMEDRSDSEDFVMIKHNQTQMRQSGRVGKRQRSSKRCRKRNPTWHKHEAGGIEVSCEGRQFRIDRPETHVPDSASKPHGCTFLKKNGDPCNARFARSEHLKRHIGSHLPDRPYGCPIVECPKHKDGIQRPDNTCDHFKTHLKAPNPGKRNGHVEWDWLKPAIWETYKDKKRAGKILHNLQKWIDDGMPGNNSRGKSS